jgi:hypothetical protein
MRYKSNMMSIKTLVLLCLVLLLAVSVSCDDDPPVEEVECIPVSGPEYWGCLPDGFVEAVHGERCSVNEGFIYCLSQSPCSCGALRCFAGTWVRYGAIDSSCRIFVCNLSRFPPNDPRGDSDGCG